MGQRTGTLVSYIDDKGQKHNKVYYNQWGIGRVQLNAIMGGFLSQIGKEGLDLAGLNHMSLEMAEDNISEMDFTDIEQVAHILRQMDNNNGGVVIFFDEREKNGNGKIGFVLGYEECEHYDEEKQEFIEDEKPFSRFVPFDEWAKKVGNPFVDEDYKAMFRAFCKHFGFTIINDNVQKGGQQWD